MSRISDLEARLSDLESDTECLLEALREQIPILEQAKRQDRAELRLMIMVGLDAFLLKWFPEEPSATGDGTATNTDDQH